MEKAYVIISMQFTRKQGTILNNTIYFDKEAAKNDCDVANYRYQRETGKKESAYKVFELGEFKPIK